MIFLATSKDGFDDRWKKPVDCFRRRTNCPRRQSRFVSNKFQQLQDFVFHFHSNFIAMPWINGQGGHLTKLKNNSHYKREGGGRGPGLQMPGKGLRKETKNQIDRKVYSFLHPDIKILSTFNQREWQRDTSWTTERRTESERGGTLWPVTKW